MKTDEIKLMYDYNYWANQRILATCARVSPEQYAASTAFGNLRSALVHTLDAEHSWRRGIKEHFVPVDAMKSGAQPEPAMMWDQEELTEANLPTLAALQELWQADEHEMRAYLASLTDQDLNGLVRYMIPGGIVRERVLWHVLLHVVNHGTQHRSEAAALLTSYGQSPGDLDITAFLNEHFHLAS